MRRRSMALVGLSVAALSTASLPGQWTVTGKVTSGSAVTGALGGAILPGPVQPGTLANWQAGPLDRATCSWSEGGAVYGPAGFRVACSCEASSGAASNWSSVSLDLDLWIAGPGTMPHSGLIRLRGTAVSALIGSATYQVDVDGDGSYELQTGTSEVVLPLAVPPSGRLCRVRVTCSASTPLLNYVGAGQAEVLGEFVPGHAVAERFATFGSGNVSLDPGLVGVDRWSLELSTPFPALTPFVTVFGFQPTQQWLAPHLTQLVLVDTVLPGGSFVFDLPVLPSGFAIYAQGVVTDGAGGFASSNSVRLRWF